MLMLNDGHVRSAIVHQLHIAFKRIILSGFDRSNTMEDTDILLIAYAGESRNAARNAMAALMADKEGRPRAARLFRAMAEAQEVHARKLRMLLRGKLGRTDANVTAATEAVESVLHDYPEMLERLQKEGDRAGEAAISQCLKVAMGHRKRLASLDEAGEVSYHVCGVCGFIAENAIPERCPICRAVPERFLAID